MFWQGDDEPDSRAAVLVRKIRELKQRNMLEISEGNALRLYEWELAQLRKDCRHDWGRPILLYNRHHRYCRRCDLEDVDYAHQD